jgi:TonB family protein
MTDTLEQKPPVPWVLIVTVLALAGIGAYLVRTVLFNEGPQEKSQLATVTLLRPTPPPLEKPPEPIIEVQNQDEMQETYEDRASRSAKDDSAPAGDDLGVDAAGAAGGDSFGLIGKKGGRSILEGTGGSSSGKVSLLTKFSGYTQVVTAEIKKKVMTWLDEEGGIPKGNLQCVVRVSLDMDGTIIQYRITGSSGNNRLDAAVTQCLRLFRISEPPPDDMPRTLDIKITSRG